MTVVYLDSVFALNASLDLLLLHTAGKLSGRPCSGKRLLLGALFGGLYAALLYLPGFGALSRPPGPCLSALALCALAFGFSPKSLRPTVLFLILSAAFAGILLALSIFAVPALRGNALPVTAPDWRLLLLAAALWDVGASLLNGRLLHPSGGKLRPACFHWRERTLSVTLLEDSGNRLQDPACHAPVSVLPLNTALSLLPLQAAQQAKDIHDPVHLFELFSRYVAPERLVLLTFRSVGRGEGLLLAIRADTLLLGTQRYTEPLIALSPNPIATASYDGIIAPI